MVHRLFTGGRLYAVGLAVDVPWKLSGFSLVEEAWMPGTIYRIWHLKTRKLLLEKFWERTLADSGTLKDQYCNT